MSDTRSVAAIARIRFLFCLDAGLLVAVVVLQTPRSTGLATHEWLGIAFAAIIALHLLVNWRWIVSTLRRTVRPDSRRAKINVLLNGTLFTFMALAVFSGLMISEVVMPFIGLRPSIFNAWRQLHDLLANLSVVVVGLHLALNWDWIAGVIRQHLLVQRVGTAVAVRELETVELNDRMEGETEPGGGTFPWVMKALGLQDLATTGRRLGVLALTVVALSASCFVLIESTASTTIRGSGVASENSLSHREITAPPRLKALPKEADLQLLLIGIAVVAGRKLLRLRL